jgi:hypothetical protein
MSSLNSNASRPTTQTTGRRAYVAPQLRHLGSVRELTLGTSNKAGEPGSMLNM